MIVHNKLYIHIALLHVTNFVVKLVFLVLLTDQLVTKYNQ